MSNLLIPRNAVIATLGAVSLALSASAPSQAAPALRSCGTYNLGQSARGAEYMRLSVHKVSCKKAYRIARAGTFQANGWRCTGNTNLYCTRKSARMQVSVGYR